MTGYIITGTEQNEVYMPELGTRIRGDSLGKTGPGAGAFWVFVECPVCKVQRWAAPKGTYEQAKNRIRHCTEHSRLARRNNFSLSNEQRPQVRGPGFE
jgi:ssDNA-binding Zn-finger/Zn-ribbon topoisomerase 1